MELWDAYKKDGTFAGFDLVRGEEIPKGYFHLISEVLVKHTDGSYLLMQRDWNKEVYPGLFEAGASGSVLKGETPYQGAVRELREETGIATDDLTFVFAFNDLTRSIYFGYLCVTDCDKSAITLQKGETISYRWLNKEEFTKFIYTDEFIGPKREKWLKFFSEI